MSSEGDIQKKIMLALSSVSSRAWRNNCGNAWQGEIVAQTPQILTLRHYRNIRFGLIEGSSDLIGIQSVVITPEMVGRRVAIFTAVEVKRPSRSKTSEQQRRFIGMVESLGGLAGFARSPEEAIQIVTRV